VANAESNNANPFDVRTIQRLVALMSRHDLSEIDLREGEVRIRLRRGPSGPIIATTAAPPVAAAAPPAASTAPPPAPAAPAAPSKNLAPIKSPTIGTFYAAAKPGAEPFVKVGSRVTPTTVVCLIEAMKLFNEIQAECSGVVTEVLVEDKQAVEYGQVLFRVDPTG
jgi:acetyl-CoA carboxylase biotin carboxyl carrier protein